MKPLLNHASLIFISKTGNVQSYLNGSPRHDMIQITIQHESNRRSLQVNSGDTIGGLKHQIQSLTGVHSDQQQLLMGSTALKDTSRRIASYNVRDGSVITLEPGCAVAAAGTSCKRKLWLLLLLCLLLLLLLFVKLWFL